MRTLAKLNKYFKDNGMQKSFDDYRRYCWNIGGVKKVETRGWSSYPEPRYDGGQWISCEVNQASFCCGVLEMGQFDGEEIPEFKEHWKAIFEYVIVKEKIPYLRTETITEGDGMPYIEAALLATGFRLVTTIPSKHGRREHKKYNINVWEYLKK